MIQDFDLLLYRHNKNTTPPFGKTSVHFYDLTIMLEGQRKYKVNNENYVLNKGDIILVPPNSERTQFRAEKCDYVSFNFTCSENLHLPVFFEKGLVPSITWLINAFDDVEKDAATNNSIIISNIIQSILAILQARKNIQDKHPLVLSIINYVANHYSNKILLSDIGKEFHYSPIYCDIIFKKEMGKTIINYITETRIYEAKKLIIESHYSLQKVSEIVGFEDYNYFARVFKKTTGYTPKQFKQVVYS